MPSPMYMRIVGVQSGDISAGAMSEASVGRLSQLSHVDRMLVVQLDGDIKLPVNETSGTPSGRRVHHGFTVHKVFDRASPSIYQILATGEECSEVVLEFWRTSRNGNEEQYFEIRAERCSITGIRTYVPNLMIPEYKGMEHMEAITFAYRRITWTHRMAGTVATDDWDR